MEDRQSDSGFGSSSGSSMSSKISVVDAETLKIGTESIRKLVLGGYVSQLLPYLIPQLEKTIEISLCYQYVSPNTLKELIFLQPIIELFAQHGIMSLSSATNNFIAKNIAKNQVIIANTYLAHYFLLAFLWAIIAFVVQFTAIQNIVDDKALVGNYLTIRGSIATITGIFSYAVEPFLKGESKYWLILCKNVIHMLIFVTLLVLLLTNKSAIGLSLTNASIAFIVADGIVAVWLIIVLFKLPILDVEYRGCLRFNFKRLSPIRPKFLLHILSETVAQFFVWGSDSILQLAVCLFIKFTTEQPQYALMQYMRLCVFTRVKSLLQCFHFAFRDIYSQVANYNMGIKKITRVFETLKQVLLWQHVIVIPISLIGIFIAPYLYEAMFPDWNSSPTYQYYKDEQKEAAMAGGWCMIFPAAYYIVVQILMMENAKWWAALLQIPILAFSCLYMIYAYQEMSDNGIYWMINAFYYIICGLIGYVMVLSYYNKYLKLHKLNASHTDKQEDKAGMTKMVQQNEQIRQSVMDNLHTATVDDEQQQQRMRMNHVNAMFDKTVALRASKVFVNMRESIGSIDIGARSSKAGSRFGSVAGQTGRFSQMPGDRGSNASQLDGQK